MLSKQTVEIRRELEYNNIKYKNNLNEKYLCKYCGFIYNKVCQAECGCRYCSECLDSVLLKGFCDCCKDELTEKEKLVDKGFQKELNNVEVECCECHWNGSLSNYLKHYKEAHNNFICKYCKEVFNDVSVLTEHLTEFPRGSCNKLNCKYHTIGCRVDNLSRTNIQQHYEEYVGVHLNYVYQHFGKQLNYIENNIELSNKYNYLEKMQIKLERLKCELDNINIEEIEKEVENQKKRLFMVQAKVLELGFRIFEQSKAAFNGVFIWKITDVSEKIEAAKSGTQKSFYSTPFYTHENNKGYKMYAKAYLNGDAVGRSTHLSLYIGIMKGEYDALLSWPFSQSVSIILIDQSERKNNIEDSFRPDPTSRSFIKPTSIMNIASGITMFCPLVVLKSPYDEYIKDDSMFIKISIDTRTMCDV